jgi:hypothetical protein
MNITLDTKGHLHPGQGWQEVVVALAQSIAAVKAEATTDLTDSTTGTPDAANAVQGVPAAFANAAASGSDLAAKAGSEVALDLVSDGFAEIIAQCNTIMTATNGATLTNSSGATTPDGTVGNVGDSGAGAATGAQAVETNADRVTLNNMLLSAVGMVNRVMDAVGSEAARVSVSAALVGSTFVDPIPAYTPDTGTAADPGIKKATLDTALSDWNDDLATLAAVLNAITGTGTAVPKVNVVR